MKKAIILGMLAILGLGGVMVQPVWATQQRPVVEPLGPEDGGAAPDGEGDETPTPSGGLGASDLCNDIEDEALRQAAGCDTVKRADDVANTIINVVLSVVGVVAVGVMIYGGFLYLTSDGNAAKLEKAKHAIMYGLIGLVVCLLAYSIVIFIGRVIPS